MFHKIVHKAWNFFNISEQSLENSAENHVPQFFIVPGENSRTWIFDFMKQYFPNSNIIITTYLCIYIYIYMS